MSIRVHGLRLPQTCYGMLHVMNTHHMYSSPSLQCDSGFVCFQTVCLTVARPSVLESAVRKRTMTQPPFICLFPDRLLVCCQTLSVCCYLSNFVCLLLLVKLITYREMNNSVHSLRLPRTCHGMLHVTDTRTHHRIYIVTVVMPRRHVKIKQRDLKGESHIICSS